MKSGPLSICFPPRRFGLFSTSMLVIKTRGDGFKKPEHKRVQNVRGLNQYTSFCSSQFHCLCFVQIYIYLYWPLVYEQ